MSTIEVKQFPEKNLTVLAVRGALTASEILRHASQSYTTKLVLWDFRNTDFSQITASEFATIAQFMRGLSSSREGGKTAFVGNEDSKLGLGHMYADLAKKQSVPVEYKVFTSVKEAKKWLAIV
ncbi:MAG: hypothetical protein JXA04_02780 [Gammaproteobacteria bacterium]|nr:hypothetical protein [Gammaproteobacteria bacterium]